MGWFSNPDAQRLTPYDLESGEWISLSDAKSEWFLTSDDLKMQLQVGSFGGGVGAGRATTYYRTNFVMKAAMRKFGDDGLRKKQEVRTRSLAPCEPCAFLSRQLSTEPVRSCAHTHSSARSDGLGPVHGAFCSSSHEPGWCVLAPVVAWFLSIHRSAELFRACTHAFRSSGLVPAGSPPFTFTAPPPRPRRLLGA
jgi:hypothetical protein